ncbi:TetR/AcrR family transcriptional regulator [Rhodococcus erythropolis]|nr:TetR/AcrR family transcriptional regulator [Rhodococcus erythropolis]
MCVTSSGRVNSGSLNRGPRDAARNRAALISAAREVFATQGFAAPLSLIARTAGVGQGSLYRHFPTRESLALAVFDENIVELQDLAADPDSTLDDLFRLLVDQITTSIVFVEVIKPVSFGDSRLNSAGTRLTDLLEGRLDEARRAGKIRESVTAEYVILAIAMFAAIMERTAESSRKEVAHAAWNLLVQGLAGPTAAG